MCQHSQADLATRIHGYAGTIGIADGGDDRGGAAVPALLQAGAVQHSGQHPALSQALPSKCPHGFCGGDVHIKVHREPRGQHNVPKGNGGTVLCTQSTRALPLCARKHEKWRLPHAANEKERKKRKARARMNSVRTQDNGTYTYMSDTPTNTCTHVHTGTHMHRHRVPGLPRTQHWHGRGDMAPITTSRVVDITAGSRSHSTQTVATATL